MTRLDRKIRAADAMGLSYGYYVALVYEPSQAMAPLDPPKKKQRGHQRQFSDEQAFSLWQQGMSDTAIGKALGVSQQRISCWRSQLELPLLSRNPINPKKYRLAYLPDGTCIAVQFDEL